MDSGVRDPRESSPAIAAAFGLSAGTILNGIYRIDRFLTRGGMGDVYLGSNVETEELVAIKVMLPRLAEDPKILSLFRSEARLLIRVAHPAVAQYRVFARDATLGVHYLVTDFIDGDALSARLHGEVPGPDEVARLIRRLAGGLRVTHELGAVHRDMSPDNILLPGGRIDEAKIIDFGIAKYVEPDDRTVVIEGFAGKLGYVAPEQFGLYGNRIGPWTDIYSTALVLLAFARSEPIDMGRTMSEAMERRSSVPDLSALPDSLHPLFRAMLQPDPAERPASMDAVVGALDTAPIVRAATPAESPAAQPAARPAAPSAKPSAGPTVAPLATPKRAGRPKSRPARSVDKRLVVALVTVIVASVLVWLAWPGTGSQPSRPKPAPAIPASRPAIASVRSMPPATPSATPPQSSSPVAQSPPIGSALPPLSIVAATSADRRRGTALCRGNGGTATTATIDGMVDARTATLVFVSPSGKPRTLVSGSAEQWARSADRRGTVRQDGAGRYRIRFCANEPGNAVLGVFDGASSLPVLPAASAGASIERYRSLAVRKNWPVIVSWIVLPATVQTRVGRGLPGTSSTPIADGYPVQGATSVGTETSSVSPPTKASAFCRRYREERWQDVGIRSRDACISAALKRGFSGYAQYGFTLLRRYDGHVETKVNGQWARLDSRADGRPAASSR